MRAIVFALSLLANIAADSLIDARGPDKPAAVKPAAVKPAAVKPAAVKPEMKPIKAVPAKCKHEIKIIAFEKHTLPSTTACHCSAGVRRDTLNLIVDFDPPVKPNEKFWFMMEIDGRGKAKVAPTLFGKHGVMEAMQMQKVGKYETVIDGQVTTGPLTYAQEEFDRAKQQLEDEKFRQKNPSKTLPPIDPGPTAWLCPISIDAEITTLQVTFSPMDMNGPILKSLKVDGKQLQIPKDSDSVAWRDFSNFCVW